MPRRLRDSGPLADVGVVDVPVGYPGHVVADAASPEVIGYLGHRRDLGSPGHEQRQELRLAGALPGHHAVQHLPEPAGGRRMTGHQHGGAGRRTGVPSGGAVVDPSDLGTVAGAVVIVHS